MNCITLLGPQTVHDWPYFSAFRRTVGSDVRDYAGYEGYLEASQRIDSEATARDGGS
jgi:hypothetical protein